MNFRYLIAVVMLFGGMLEAIDAEAASRTERLTGMSRQEIRSLPITARPSRPGHFYGNTVRRMNGR